MVSILCSEMFFGFFFDIPVAVLYVFTFGLVSDPLRFEAPRGAGTIRDVRGSPEVLAKVASQPRGSRNEFAKHTNEWHSHIGLVTTKGAQRKQVES